VPLVSWGGGGWSPEAPFKAHFHILHRSSLSSVQGVKAWAGGAEGVFPLPFQPPRTFGSRTDPSRGCSAHTEAPCMGHTPTT
ncbi:unnamed protein product, partial [Gulo gulo]